MTALKRYLSSASWLACTAAIRLLFDDRIEHTADWFVTYYNNGGYVEETIELLAMIAAGHRDDAVAAEAADLAYQLVEASARHHERTA